MPIDTLRLILLVLYLHLNALELPWVIMQQLHWLHVIFRQIHNFLPLRVPLTSTMIPKTLLALAALSQSIMGRPTPQASG